MRSPFAYVITVLMSATITINYLSEESGSQQDGRVLRNHPPLAWISRNTCDVSASARELAAGGEPVAITNQLHDLVAPRLITVLITSCRYN